MEGFIETVMRKMSTSDDSGLSTSPGESNESRSGSFSSESNMQGKDTPAPISSPITVNSVLSANPSNATSSPNQLIKQSSGFHQHSICNRPVIRITVEPVSSDDSDGEDDQDSSIFLELSESGTGYSDKTLIELDTLIDDVGIMVACEPIHDGEVGDNDHDHQLQTHQRRHHSEEFLSCDYLDHLSGKLVVASPSQTNLSDGSDENNSGGSGDVNRETNNNNQKEGGVGEGCDEGGLKVEEIKPRRRNTIADIFRWLVILFNGRIRRKIYGINFIVEYKARELNGLHYIEWCNGRQ